MKKINSVIGSKKSFHFKIFSRCILYAIINTWYCELRILQYTFYLYYYYFYYTYRHISCAARHSRSHSLSASACFSRPVLNRTSRAKFIVGPSENASEVSDFYSARFRRGYAAAETDVSHNIILYTRIIL